jgi:hypothetical protein
MALHEDIGRQARKLFLPAAASVAGAGAGLMLTRKSTRKSVRDAMPELGNSRLGNLADDLREMLDSVVDKGSSATRLVRGSSDSHRRIDPQKLHQRVQEREQRRSKRRART